MKTVPIRKDQSTHPVKRGVNKQPAVPFRSRQTTKGSLMRSNGTHNQSNQVSSPFLFIISVKTSSIVIGQPKDLSYQATGFTVRFEGPGNLIESRLVPESQAVRLGCAPIRNIDPSLGVTIGMVKASQQTREAPLSY